MSEVATPKSISVIIPVYGPEHFLTACLAALATNTPEQIELVCVDNGTGIRIPEGLGCIAICNPTNLGFAIACNQGAKAASGDVLVFLNMDTEVRAGWLAPLVEAISRDSVGIVGSKLVYPNGLIQHAGVEFYRDGQTLGARNVHEERPAGYVVGVTGACLAITRECFDACDGFDEGFYNGYDDVDLCLTATSFDYLIWYEPESVVMHHESVTGPERGVRCANNVAYLNEKWG